MTKYVAEYIHSDGGYTRYYITDDITKIYRSLLIEEGDLDPSSIKTPEELNRLWNQCGDIYVDEGYYPSGWKIYPWEEPKFVCL